MSLLTNGNFTLHAGGQSDFKIDCDALTELEIDEIAKFVAARITFNRVIGVPKGGSRLADALKRYQDGGDGGTVLLVDDVWTTGKAMNNIKKLFKKNIDVIGFVIFARANPEAWVRVLFHVGDFADTRLPEDDLLAEAWPDD
jgi:orotate phosphoribosyltransferase